MKLLEGIRVLDISRLIPGPYVTMLLADMGADVIKVEEDKIGDYLRAGRDPDKYGGQSALHLWINRGKRDISVDLMSPAGREVIYDFAKTCDVFVENARPGASAKLGYGYDDIRKVRPDVVYCSVTAFGQDGPYAQLGTHGGAYDAVVGLAVPYQLDDGSYVQYRPFPHALMYGVWLGAMAVCAGIVRAKLHGEGSYFDISNSDATVLALGQELLPVINGESEGWSVDQEQPSVKYCYYKTKDGRFMLIQAIEQKFWQHFCDVVGRPDLRDRGDWSVSRMDSSVGDMELREELIKIFATKTQEEWIKIFLDHNIAGGPYHPLNELQHTELFKARKMIIDQPIIGAGSFRTAANGIKRKGDPFQVKPAPNKGQHTDELLKEIGYSSDRIKELHSKAVVSSAK